MKDIKDESFVSVMKYREKWNKLHDEIVATWEMYLTNEGKFDGLTSFMMNKIWEARTEGRQEAWDALQENKEE